MGHPFLVASRRAGSRTSPDYQSRFRAPDGKTPDFKELYKGKISPGKLPQNVGALDALKLANPQARPSLARAKSAAGLLRRLPLYGVAAGLVGWAIYRGLQAETWNMPGNFVHHKFCTPPIPPGTGKTFFGVATTNCLTHQYLGRKYTTGPASDYPIPGTIVWPFDSFANNRYPFLALYSMHEPGGNEHLAWTKQIWSNTCYRDLCLGSTATPQHVPQVLPLALPAPSGFRDRLPWEQLAPESIGIKEFGPTPRPIPHKWLPAREGNPYRVQAEAPQWGPVAPPRGILETAGKSYEQTETGGLREVPPRHRFRRDTKNMRTKKVRFQARAILFAVNLVTESFDLIDALYDALPKNKKRLKKHRGLKIMRPQHKLEVLWENGADIDVKDAFKNLVENQAEDYAFGKMSQGLNKLNRKLGRPVGVEAGGALGGKAVRENIKGGKAPWDGWTDYIWP